MEDLTLIIPAKNEKESLPKVLEELKKFNFNIKICLDKNDIETIDSIKDSGCEIIYQPKKGYGNALIHGINICNTKYFCIFNADGSFNPKEISAMLNKLVVENLDVVFASRYQKGSKVKNVPFLRLLLSYLAFLVLNILYKTKGIKDFTSGYRFYDKFAINNFFRKIEKKYVPKQGFEMQLEIILKLRKSNLKFYEIPINLDYKKKTY